MPLYASDLFRLYKPTVAGKDQLAANIAATARRKIIRSPTASVRPLNSIFCLTTVSAIATQLDSLEKTAVVARRFETPAREIHREELRGRIESARRRVASFHFVGSDERQIVFRLCGTDGINAAR